MRSVSVLVLTLFILLVQSSCKKATDSNSSSQVQQPPVSVDSMFRCHTATALDSAGIRSGLLGKWQWEFIRCYWNPEDANGDDFKNLAVEIKADNTVTVKENGVTTQTATWALTRLNDGYFKLTTNPLVLQLPGRIYLCSDRVLFFDSYIDGCDNFFKKQY